MCGEKEEEEEAEVILIVLTTGVALVKTEIRSILNPWPSPQLSGQCQGCWIWGGPGEGTGGQTAGFGGYFNVLTTSTNSECALMSGGQHSRSEDLVEVAPVPWKGCPGKTVHGTAEALRWPGQV